MYFSKIVVLVTVFCATTKIHCQNIPSLDSFLSFLFEATSNEIENLTNNFNFHSVSPKDLKFILHHKNNKTEILNLKKLPKIDTTKPTKILIHGWQASGTDPLNEKIALAYHQTNDVNIIAIDWSEHSKKVYMHSASSTKDIGHFLGDFILQLVGDNLEHLANVHIIGHSLGGHVAGFAGQRLADLVSRKVGRITGLDVAAPMFEIPQKRRNEEMLSKDDADFVDVIHTNIGFLGVSQALGSADFYMENGGPLQPDCIDINIFEAFVCSHMKAFDYFLESINGAKFEALACNNSIDYHLLACNGNEKVAMGENVSKKAKGTFYLEKNSALPYGRILKNPFELIPRFRVPLI